MASSRRLGYKSNVLSAILKVLDGGGDDRAAEDENGGDDDRTTVIVTDGPSPILCFDVERGGGGRARSLERVPVPALDASAIADTIGAGDGFVAGYVEGLVKGRSRRQCVKRGVSDTQ